MCCVVFCICFWVLLLYWNNADLNTDIELLIQVGGHSTVTESSEADMSRTTEQAYPRCSLSQNQVLI